MIQQHALTFGSTLNWFFHFSAFSSRLSLLFLIHHPFMHHGLMKHHNESVYFSAYTIELQAHYKNMNLKTWTAQLVTGMSRLFKQMLILFIGPITSYQRRQWPNTVFVYALVKSIHLFCCQLREQKWHANTLIHTNAQTCTSSASGKWCRGFRWRQQIALVSSCTESIRKNVHLTIAYSTQAQTQAPIYNWQEKFK